ncbi:MAG: 4-hydroxythreonine-4-phosphate dehydrogenase PdxA [Planctomycetes bacterium]|nr:4-hydroxythreonine-4-phosphate dehydrogenase PdxA [Planctomycetota bacterium]
MLDKTITLAITLGDPDGIGYEITLKALKDKEVQSLGAEFILIGEESLFVEIQAELKSELPRGMKTFFHNITPAPGKTGRENAVFETIVHAVKLVMEGAVQGIVTAPVNKEKLNNAGIPFKGHTELISNLSNAKNTLMTFVAPRQVAGTVLHVGLVTTHLALKKLSLYLTQERVHAALMVLDGGLREYFGITRPKISVCGLNPHAGENGLFGNEELQIIRPAMEQARKSGIDCEGPFPADMIFYKAFRGGYDAVLAMYHDQGLIPVKMLNQFEAVNVTLGLPFVRTSPAHGTAYDIVGKGIADSTSMKNAILFAYQMIMAGKKKSLF